MELMQETLREGLPALGLTLSDEVQQTLCAFAHAMVRQNEVMNLTGITEDAAVAKLHLLDSLTVCAAIDLKGKTLIDVGCGAGFPGVPLAIACTDTKVTLLDSLGKRMKWLEQILPQLENLANVVVGDDIQLGGIVGGAVIPYVGSAGYEMFLVHRSEDPGALLRGVATLFARSPAVTLTEKQTLRCRNGNSFSVTYPDGTYRAYSESGEFLMLAKVEEGVMSTVKSFFEVE